MAHIVLYIATSRDGFIADKNGGVDWLPQPEEGGDDCGFHDFLKTIDVIAQGSKTFVQTIGFVEQGLVPDLPYDGKHMYVFTREPMVTNRSDVTFVSSIQEFLDILEKNKQIKRVWLLGGAELVASFHAHNLIDEAIITIIPKDIHEGIALPKQIFDTFCEVETKKFAQGIIEKRYVRC